MKLIFSLRFFLFALAALVLSQTGCTVNTVAVRPGGFYNPPLGVSSWSRAGFYRGATVRRNTWDVNRGVTVGSTSWNRRNQVSSASWGRSNWNTRRGSVTTVRTGSASWGRGNVRVR